MFQDYRNGRAQQPKPLASHAENPNQDALPFPNRTYGSNKFNFNGRKSVPNRSGNSITLFHGKGVTMGLSPLKIN